MKYKAPGFDIFQKSDENGSLTLFFMINDILCLCFVKEDISKEYEAFWAGYFRWTCKILQIFCLRCHWFNGSACIFSTFAHLISC